MPIWNSRNTRGFNFNLSQIPGQLFGSNYVKFPIFSLPPGGVDDGFPNTPGYKTVGELRVYTRFQHAGYGAQIELGYFPALIRWTGGLGNVAWQRMWLAAATVSGTPAHNLKLFEGGQCMVGYEFDPALNSFFSYSNSLLVEERIGVGIKPTQDEFGNNFFHIHGLIDINPDEGEEPIQLIVRGTFTPESETDIRGIIGSIVPGEPGILHVKGSDGKWYTFRSDGVPETNPPDINEISIENDFINPQQLFNFVTLRQSVTQTGNYPTTSFSVSSYPSINEGLTNSAATIALLIVALRNHFPNNADKGNLAEIRALDLRYGNSNTEANSPGTTNVYGLRLTPYTASGIVANIFDIYISPHQGGGSNNIHFGLYIASITSGAGQNNYAIYTNIGLNRFGDHIILANGKNFQFSTITGSIIGQAANQKLSFWGASPIVQPEGYSQNYSLTSRIVNPYPAPQGINSFTGIASGQAGNPYASLTDLNTLYKEVQSLRASLTNSIQVLNSLIDDHQSSGLCNSAAPATPVSSPPSFVAFSSSSSATGTTTISISPPIGIQEGDLLVAFICHNQTDLSSPGWNRIRTTSHTGTTTTFIVRTDVLWKIATNSESTYTFTNVNSSGMTNGAMIAAFRNVDPTTPIQSENIALIAEGSTSYGVSGIATTKANSLLFFGVGARNGAALPGTNNNWSSPAEMTEIGEVVPDAVAGRRLVAASYQLIGAVQTGIAKSTTGPSGYGIAHAIVLNPKP